ncbi:hypothetical protein RJ639_014687 [Escallonia herrerae]|uniref:KIB1-4 beta-propeller domain-containing protein n=1 Tax=Escallonia herrerae TaxID=1293975 RepID=A0AA88VI55_9ASTE|nr:hypothetical protein RJ639_014687 [Escallonia herrerae]
MAFFGRLHRCSAPLLRIGVEGAWRIRATAKPRRQSPFWRRSVSTSAAPLSDSARRRHHPQSPVLTSPWLLIQRTPDSATEDGTGFSSSDTYLFYRLSDRGMISLKTKPTGSPGKIPDDALCVGSSHGWLAYASLRRGTYFLTNPVICCPTPRPTISLPPVQTLPAVSFAQESEDRDLVLKLGLKDNLTGGFIEQKIEDLYSYLIVKVVMSSDPIKDKNTVVMAIQGQRYEISFCRPGGVRWGYLKGQNRRGYSDLGYSQKHKLFYALFRTGYVFDAWDLNDPSSPKRIEYAFERYLNRPEWKGDEEMIRDMSVPIQYLVVDESSGGEDKILVLTRYVARGVLENGGGAVTIAEEFENDIPYKTLRFDIYEVVSMKKGDSEVRVSRYVKNIGDRVLFLGRSHSFILSADDYPELTPSSIYFTDDWGVMSSCGDYGPPADYPYEGHDMGVYHLEDCSVTHHYHPSRLEKKLTRPPPMWFTPNQCN